MGQRKIWAAASWKLTPSSFELLYLAATEDPAVSDPRASKGKPGLPSVAGIDRLERTK